MIGHQAVGQNFNFVLLTICLQPSQVDLSIFVCIEDVFSTVTSLRYVVRHSCKYGSGLSWHWTILTELTEKGSVPNGTYLSDKNQLNQRLQHFEGIHKASQLAILSLHWIPAQGRDDDRFRLM
jgi:hypothetical protein